MKEKILKNIALGRYRDKNTNGYINKNHGWTDYLLYDNIIFSHRVNDYSSGELPEKLHAHDYYELSVVLSGEGVQYISENRFINIKSGTAVLTKPSRIHMFRLQKPICYDRIVIYFKDLSKVFPDRAIMDFTQSQSEFLLFRPPIDMLKAVDCNNMPMAYLKICELVLLLPKYKMSEAMGVDTPDFLYDIKKYIDKNYLSIHSVNELADRFFYSREYISRAFRSYYNTPVYEYIINRKMLHCCKLLSKGECVETAARKSGFHNISSFFKLFKKYMGDTPSEYRSKHITICN